MPLRTEADQARDDSATQLLEKQLFKDMKIGTRLIMGFLFVTLLGAIVAAIGIRNMSEMNEEAELLYGKELLGLSYIKEANLNLSNLGRSLRNALLATSEQERSKFIDEAQGHRNLLERHLHEARQRFVTERGQALFTELDNSLRTYEPMIAELVKQTRAAPLQEQNEALDYLGTVYGPALAPVTAKLNELSRLKEENAERVAKANTELYNVSRGWMILLVACSAVIGMALGALLTRRLTRQLGGEPAYAAAIAERIAAGDLVVDIALRSSDQSSLLFAMKKMRDSLASLVGQVRSGTDAIASASNQIASGNLDLSARTEQQASSLEETASSMEELTSTVKQNADNARQANQLATSASGVASRGGAVVSQVVETMGAINESSRKVVDIIAVIDGIAFQTNILALNAAVEAARAGEQGRGFAVVASEVRNLAQRSAAAAKEIKLLIGDSVEKVDAGTELVNEAGATMKEIVDSIQRVTDIMGEITIASQEQTSGIEQINQAITQMDEVTQQNAALVEEAAAASAAMQEQAAQLASLVSVFRISEQSTPRADSSTPAKPAALPGAPARRQSAPAVPAKPRQLATSGAEWEEF